MSTHDPNGPPPLPDASDRPQSENRMLDRVEPGPRLPRATNNERNPGSIVAGFFAGWATMIASGAITLFVSTSTTHNGAHGPAERILSSLAALLPLASMAALIFWFAVKGKNRSVLGVVAAIGSIMALLLLLVAACFGLLMTQIHN